MGFLSGLFKSKKKKRAGISASPIELELTHPVTDTVANSVLGEDDITQKILDATLKGLRTKLQHYQDYGRYSYTNGLPNAYLNYAPTKQPEITSIIEGIEGDTVTLEVFEEKDCDLTYFIADHVIDEYGISAFVADQPVPVTTSKYAAPYCYYLGEEENEDDNTQVLLVFYFDSSPLPVMTLDQLEAWEPDPRKLYREPVSVPAYNSYGTYYHVRYRRRDGSKGYWSYERGLGTYPELDLYEEQNQGHRMYPIVPIRQYSNNPARASLRNGEHFITATGLMDTLDLDYRYLCDAMASNKDAKYIEGTYFIPAVKFGNTEPAVTKYLGRYFADLEDAQYFDENAYQLGGWGYNWLRMREPGLYLAMGFDYVKNQLVDGSIGAVGTVSVQRTHGSFLFNPGGDPSDDMTRWVSALVYREQVSDSQYRETVVHNPKQYHRGHHGKGVSYSLGSYSAGRPWLIPLRRDVLETLTPWEQQIVISQGLHMLVQTYQETRIPWYARGALGKIIDVISIILIVSGVFSGIGTFLKTAAREGLKQAVLQAVKSVIKAYILKLVFRYAVQNLDPRLAAALAVAAAALGVSKEADWFELDFLPDAEMLLVASQGIQEGTQMGLMDDYAELASRQQSFAELEEQRQEELERLEEAAAQDVQLDAYAYTAYFNSLRVWESPDDFYNRTIHLGNIGVRTLDAIGSYCDNALELPKGDNFV